MAVQRKRRRYRQCQGAILQAQRPPVRLLLGPLPSAACSVGWAASWEPPWLLQRYLAAFASCSHRPSSQPRQHQSLANFQLRKACTGTVSQASGVHKHMCDVEGDDCCRKRPSWEQRRTPFSTTRSARCGESVALRSLRPWRPSLRRPVLPARPAALPPLQVFAGQYYACFCRSPVK